MKSQRSYLDFCHLMYFFLILFFSSADPYLIALTEDGEMILISLDTTRPKQPEISIVKANLKSRSRLVFGLYLTLFFIAFKVHIF